MNAIRTTLLVALATVVLIGTGGVAGAVAAAPSDAGPPNDLPEPVPDFAGDLLDSIGELLADGVDDLGETVSDIAGNGADDASTESSE